MATSLHQGWIQRLAIIVIAFLGILHTCCDSPAVSQQKPDETKKSGQPKQGNVDESKSNQEPEPVNKGEPKSDEPNKDDSKGDEPKVDEDEPKADEPKTDEDEPKNNEEEPVEASPFAHRIRIPDFPKDAKWINTGGPLRKADLKGKFVILDFWTYCCINCIHILPELKKLEHKYPNELVVIGVHSAKFETEKDSKNISEAILRYEIEHPVINDHDHRVWNTFGVRSWPTVLMIDPEGYAVWGRSGEIQFENVDAILKNAMPYYRKRKLLDDSPIHFDLLAHRQEETPLRFPGKVLADAENNRLFISDSNHNRIVITSLDTPNSGKVIDIIGSGAIGRDDGGYDEASFDHPQGMVLHKQTLYVADTENHMIRKVDLAKKTVKTIAGVGQQGRNPWPGLENIARTDPLPERWVGPPMETGLNSPWALWVHESDLYIAMAGPHQIWKMPLDESEIGPYAGNGREDIVDGPLLPQQPYETGFSSFAQPSGLTSDGTWLYVADSEGSSIRAVPFDATKEVKTVTGSSMLPGGRLFAFGDVDGKQPHVVYAKDEDGSFVRDVNGEMKMEGVQLQHALGVVYNEGKIYIADTYNNKVKVTDAKTGETHTIAGTGEPGKDDAAATFDEPAGITIAGDVLYIADTNNHLIRTFDLKTKEVGTFEVAGLTPPNPPTQEKPSAFAGASKVKAKAQTVKATDGKVKVRIKLDLPAGWKINPLAPMSFHVSTDEKPKRIEIPAAEVEVTVAADSIQDSLTVSMNYFYCQEGGEGLCKVGSVQWTAAVKVDANAESDAVQLTHIIEP